MALVLICGQPCSGKSTAAESLKNAILSEPSFSSNIRIIDEASLHLDRNKSYADMPSEKNLRGVLRSEVDRSVSKDCILIVDSLNNIKGYRYELWCLARAAGIRYCVLYCDVAEDLIRAWNTARHDEGKPAYADKILDDLIRRFEKPDRRNRWDSPLFELKPSEEPTLESSPLILEAVTFLTKTIDKNSRDAKLLQPTIATQNARISQTNSLYELDCATQVMLLGHDDHYSTDKNMKVTVAFNHFGPGCGQRMPRVRYGFAHVANNYYEPWGIYAIGGSMGPSIRSEGNRFMAPTDRFKKQVTARECSGGSCKGWRWRSVRDGFMNGAYFLESAGARDPVSPGYDASQRFSVLHNRRITTVTNDAGVLTCYFGRPCY